MFLNFSNSVIYALVIMGLGAAGCGKKSSSTPPPSTWDGASDRNTSDLVVKDIEP